MVGIEAGDGTLDGEGAFRGVGGTRDNAKKHTLVLITVSPVSVDWAGPLP